LQKSTYRVLVLTETFHPEIGGGETQTKNLCEAFASDGHEVTVVTRRSSPASLRQETLSGARVVRLGPSGRGQLKKRYFAFSLLPFLLWRWGRYDVILVSGFRVIGLSAVLASLILGKPCVLKADSLGELSGRCFEEGLTRYGLSLDSTAIRFFLKLRRKLLVQAAGYIAISTVVRDEFIAEGVDPARVRTIPNAVNLDRFHRVDAKRKQASRRQLGLSDDALVVVYTGRLVSYKGLPLLLEVWEALHRRYDGAKLLLVGPGSLDIQNCEDELKEFVRAKSLTHCVEFTGSVADVPTYLQASDIFVFPTENEAFGLSLIEAMACGVAPISTPVGGIKDIIQDGKNGLFVPVGNKAELAAALDRLMTDRALTAELGAAAEETARRRFSLPRIKELYIELFGRLVGS
jgi:glycosyltransferase involved in cell wall biosynthesis